MKAATGQVLEGIQGAHDAVEEGGNYPFDYLAFQEKLGRFARESVPRFESYQERNRRLSNLKKRHCACMNLAARSVILCAEPVGG